MITPAQEITKQRLNKMWDDVCAEHGVENVYDLPKDVYRKWANIADYYLYRRYDGVIFYRPYLY